ncbi:MAG: ATP-binding protein [Ginsengibacter sp.]
MMQENKNELQENPVIYRSTEARHFNLAILNSLSSQIVVLDKAGNIQSANTAWTECFQKYFPRQSKENNSMDVSFTELYGSPDIFGDVREPVLAGIESVLQMDISSFSIEHPLLLNGEQHWFLMSVNPLPENHGAVISHTDITERKQIDQMKNEFIGIASHELKTPITSLKGIVHILQLSYAKQFKGEFSRLLSTMDIQLNKLNKIIGDLLVINTIPGKEIHLGVERFNFKTLIRETIQNVRNISPLHFFTIQENESVFVNADRFKMEQVITNLLTNAVKYSPQSNQVVVNSIVQNNHLIFSVQDFGLGIDQDHVTRIFERFYRVKTGLAMGGLGLGLYISHEIIKAHQGELWVNSKKGEGSKFYFSLPLAANNS